MKNAEHGTRLKEDSTRAPKTSPKNQTDKHPDDARDEHQAGDVDRNKIADNRDKLGVDENHKSADMRRGQRGTYP